MAMLAYKGFKKGLIATLGKGAYQYHEGENICDGAQAHCYGFHCVEDPLDMLAYYPICKENEHWVVVACGDINEDGNDSKIACTRMFIKRKLSVPEIAAASMLYMRNHPDRMRDYSCSHFKIVHGTKPVASGKNGQWLCFVICDAKHKKVKRIGMLCIDGKQYLPNINYDIDGNIYEPEDANAAEGPGGTRKENKL